jgi:hypothetical protein
MAAGSPVQHWALGLGSQTTNKGLLKRSISHEGSRVPPPSQPCDSPAHVLGQALQPAYVQQCMAAAMCGQAPCIMHEPYLKVSG